jgi:hypothetical protein
MTARFAPHSGRAIWDHRHHANLVRIASSLRADMIFGKDSGDVDAGLAELEAPAGALLDDLLWWTAALKAARARAS